MRFQRRPRFRLCVELLENRLAMSALTVSTNWAGYAVQTNLDYPQAGAVTAVSGSWTVPAARGRGTAYSSVWVGIDGYSSGTVEQIGTDSDIIGGQPVYYVWYEMYPRPAVVVNSMTVRPGDQVSASVQYVSGQFLLQISNHTNGKSFGVARSMARAERSSAEWIVEAPSSDYGVLPLANFGTVTITGATATVNGRTDSIDSLYWDSAAMNMVGRRTVKAITSDTFDNGGSSSFQVTFLASTGNLRARRRIFREENVTTVFSGLTAVPATVVVVRTVTTPVPAASFNRLTTTLPPSDQLSGFASSRISYIGYSIAAAAGEDGDENREDVLTPPAGERGRDAERLQVPPTIIQQGAPAAPRLPQQVPNDEVRLPDEQALSLLFAELGAADELRDASQAEAGSPLQLAALTSVLLFAGTPLVKVPERQKRRQAQVA